MKNKKARFANLLAAAINLLEYDYEERKTHPLISLIKLLSDKIVFDNGLELIATDKPKYQHGNIRTFLSYDSPTSSILFSAKEIGAELEISLDKDPVITLPWESGRIERAIGKIGTCLKCGEFEENKTNHMHYTYLPLCTTIIYNGLHSSFSGILKREGVIHTDEHNKVYDISELYDHIYFDGIHFRDIKTKKKLLKSTSFEFGCIFEIGRLIKKQNQKQGGEKIYYKGILL